LSLLLLFKGILTSFFEKIIIIALHFMKLFIKIIYKAFILFI
jgi:hypothetical protein